MIVTVDGLAAHAATGGVELTGNDPVVLLIHGAGMDSSVWSLQTRYLAYRGFRAVAVDLPGHGASEGEPLGSIAEMAEWMHRFIEAAGFSSVRLVGHSMGTFIGLELAAHYPKSIESLVLMGTATGMPVHPELIEAAATDLPRAAALMAAWGHAKPAHIGLNPTPGLWMTGGARALVENSTPGVLSADFGACSSYEGAVTAAESVTCRATIIIGAGDKMTPPRSGRELASKLGDVTVIELADVGHTMMTESPRAVRTALMTALAA